MEFLEHFASLPFARPDEVLVACELETRLRCYNKNYLYRLTVVYHILSISYVLYVPIDSNNKKTPNTTLCNSDERLKNNKSR